MVEILISAIYLPSMLANTVQFNMEFGELKKNLGFHVDKHF